MAKRWDQRADWTDNPCPANGLVGAEALPVDPAQPRGGIVKVVKTGRNPL